MRNRKEPEIVPSRGRRGEEDRKLILISKGVMAVAEGRSEIRGS